MTYGTTILTTSEHATGAAVLLAVGEASGLDVLAQSRRRPYVIAREVACQIMQERGIPVKGIAAMVERDHSTVVHTLDSARWDERYSRTHTQSDFYQLKQAALALLNNSRI